MDEHEEQQGTGVLRIWLCGPLRLEWVDPASGQALAPATTTTGGRDHAPALSLLGLLLCQPHRQAYRDWIMEQFWPESVRSVAVHRLENIFCCLRNVLRPPFGGESLLFSTRGKKNTGMLYSLAAYPKLWLDSDALRWNVEQAARMQRFGEDSLPFWERAFALLKRGSFLCDEPYALWAKERREQFEGSSRQCVHALSSLYLARQGEAGKAEALLLLRTYWQQHKTDEDALRPLMELLGAQERYQEAEEYYQQLLLTLAEREPAEEGQSPEPDARTQDIREFLRTRQIQRQRVQLPTTNVIEELNTTPLHLPSEKRRSVSHLKPRSSDWGESAEQSSSTPREESMLQLAQEQQLAARDGRIFPLSSYVTKQVSFDQEALKAYQSLLPAYWEAYYMSSRAITLDEIDVIIQDLGCMIVYGNAHQQTEIQELLCQYHQFALDLARDQGNFERALYHAHFTLFLATQTGNNELLAACLYRRGLTYFDMGDLSTAANDLRDALPFAYLARPQLQGMVTMEAARFQAHLEPGEKEKVLQIDQLLDQTQRLVENGPLEDDAGHVKLDKGRYHIGRAATLLALKRSTTARGELDEAARLIKQEHRRRHAYITILRARTHFVEGDFDYAAHFALDAATSCLAIQSKSNLADLTRFYASLTQTSFKYAPTTVQLGVILRTQK